MKKNLKNLTLALFAMTFSFLGTNAYAACSDKNCTSVKINQIIPSTGGTVYIGTSGDESQLSCPAVGDKYLSLDINKPLAKEIFSTILASQKSKTSMVLRIDENSPDCEIIYVISYDN